jgi:hypothetical protein
VGFVRNEEQRCDGPLGYADAIKRHIETATGDLRRYHKALMTEVGRPHPGSNGFIMTWSHFRRPPLPMPMRAFSRAS